MRLITFLILVWAGVANAAPVLNFSDIESGPKTGNTDTLGSGAIVTIWGNNLGSSQGTSTVSVGGVVTDHVYYWKDADGQLPGGPSDLKTYHKMQEVCFSVPAGVADGLVDIKVTVDGVDSTTLPFTVRAGNIRFIKSGGVDSGQGTWSSPWATIGYVSGGAGGAFVAGDLVYTVGIGTTAGVVMTAPTNATATNPVAVIAYPNTSPTITATNTASGFVVYNSSSANCGYWGWSKIKVICTQDASGNSAVSGFNGSRGARFIGIELTGPTAYHGFTGAWGGSGTVQAGGLKILGAYIHHYGIDNDVSTSGNIGSNDSYGSTWSVSQHLFYLSVRSTTVQIEGYEIGWGHFTDNPMYQGIHVYDMSDSIGWTTPLYIHDNVVKNQRGNSINIDLQSASPNDTPIYIYNNVTISDSSDTYGIQALGIITTNVDQPIYVYNNTFYGYKTQNSLSNNHLTYRNNIMYDVSGIAFYSGTPTAHSNNLFYSSYGSPPAQPSWATSESGHVTGDPLFTNTSVYDFSISSALSPVVDAGYDTSAIATHDILGLSRSGLTVDIGAFEFTEGGSSPSAGLTNNRATFKPGNTHATRKAGNTAAKIQ